MSVIKHVSCGCCTNGCVCLNHVDIPRGIKPKLCDYCMKLAKAPLNTTYRFDPQLQEYVRKTQGN